MVMRRILLLSGLALVWAAPASAQDPPPYVPPPVNVLDFGVRGTSTTGDAARYERYRDMGNGLFLEKMRWDKTREGWFYRVAADHVGRKDQRYVADFTRPGRFKATAMWDQIPMLMSRTTQTLFTAPTSPAVLAVDDGIQSQVQANTSTLGPLFDANARTFELDSRRFIGEGKAEYIASSELTLQTVVRRTDREGTIPFGGSFGHSSLVETPAPVNFTILDFDASAEYEKDRLLLRGGYTGSFFNNEAQSLLFDSPFRLTDSTSAGSHGNLALAPSNSFIGVNGLAAVSMPYRTRATATISVSSLENSSDTPIIPHTVNAALPVVPLERATVEGQAHVVSSTLMVTSRPTKKLDLSLRYRLYDYDNRTPVFTINQRVPYDNSVSTLTQPCNLPDPTGCKETEAFGLVRNTVDADVRVMPGAGVTAGFGYSHVSEDRSHRIYESIGDNIVRLTFDMPKNPFVTLRTKYEHSEKRGEGDPQEIAVQLLAIGEQPGMRHFDVASRNRNRVTILGSTMPRDYLGLTFSIAQGKDDYIESEFGVRDNTHRIYTVGADFAPLERNFSISGSYDYERYQAFSRSRQASSAAEFINPTRNWASDGTDRVHSFLLSASVLKIASKIDLNLAYDFNRAHSEYLYVTGPVPDRTLPEEIEVPTTLPPPTQLPLVKNELHRGTVDVVYALTAKLGLGLSVWYEDYNVADWTLDAEANPDLVRSQAVLLGYTYQPYTATTIWGRLIYRW